MKEENFFWFSFESTPFSFLTSAPSDLSEPQESKLGHFFFRFPRRLPVSPFVFACPLGASTPEPAKVITV